MSNDEVRRWKAVASIKTRSPFVSIEYVEVDVVSACDHERIVAEKDAEIDRLRTVLEAVRSQMCWERDRDQLTIGMASLHDDVTKALEKKAMGK